MRVKVLRVRRGLFFTSRKKYRDPIQYPMIRGFIFSWGDVGWDRRILIRNQPR